MKCPKCGFEIQENLPFCPKCGVDLDEYTAAEEAVGTRELGESRSEEGEFSLTGEEPVRNHYYEPEPSKVRFYQKTWLIVLALIFFWPIGVILMWKFAKWNKIVKIIISILCVFALIGLFTGNNNESADTSDSSPAIEETSDIDSSEETKKDAGKATIEMKEGYNKLQSLYLQIDDSFTEDKITKIVEDNDLYMESYSVAGAGMYQIDISETEGTMGAGAETWYQFDTDSIHLTLFADEDRGNTVYVFSKDYYVIDNMMSVNYTFYDSELYTEGSIPGYSGGTHETIDDWESIEDALKYALSYEK